MNREIAFEVTGNPVPQGSIKSFRHPRTGGIISTYGNKRRLDEWRDAIRYHAQQLNEPCVEGAVQLTIAFAFAKPKSLKKSVRYHVTRPDLDKLIRAVLDALTGVLFRDDSQVDYIVTEKRYARDGEASGVKITVSQRGDG